MCRSHNASYKALLKKYFYLALPHVSLIFVSMAYTTLGAFVFMKLEEPHVRGVYVQAVNQVKTDYDQLLSRLIELSQNRDSLEKGEVEFRKYVRNIYAVRKSVNLKVHESWPDVNDGAAFESRQQWSFAVAMFFVLTTLTTIGYGNIVPLTRAGRAFCICYCVVGIPLILVTTANVAKFMSAGAYFVFTKYLLLKERFVKWFKSLTLFTKRVGSVDKLSVELWHEQSGVLKTMRNVQYVRLSAPVILLIIIGYAASGALLMSKIESWSLVDSFYFSIISIFTVGFGDFVPTQKAFLIVSELYILIGLLVATMCVDTVGVQYVQRMHQLGRSIRDADYHRLMRIMKARQLSLKSDYVRYREKRLTTFTLESKSESESEVESDSPLSLNVRVTDVTPYSIGIKWELPHEDCNDEPHCTYHIEYKTVLAGVRDQTVHYFTTKSNSCLLTNLCSFTAYSILLKAVQGNCQRAHVNLLVVTEPETSPQNISVRRIDPRTAFIRWSPPYKNKDLVKSYAIYYSNNLPMTFENWTKLNVPADQLCTSVNDLSDPEEYYFCMSSVYETFHSPLSKPVSISENPKVKPDFLSYAKVHMWSWTPIFGFGLRHNILDNISNV